EGRSNYLAGSMTVDGVDVTIPTDHGAPILDPDFNQAHFDGLYVCLSCLKLFVIEADCAFVTPLAEGAARLLIQTVGTLGTMVNADTVCGFDTTTVKLMPSQVVGSAGQMGSMAWNISQCK